jgi:hypothetical protein
MCRDVFHKLREQVDQFSAWADTRPIESRSGEWECDYRDWDLLYTSFSRFIRECPVQHWDRSMMEMVMYIVARDNEAEFMMQELAEDSDRLLAVASACIQSAEWDAKWQVASALGESSAQQQEVEPLLLRLVEDEDEYVRRRALLALGNIRSPHVALLAEQIWNREDAMQEYQRMAVLGALRDTDSPLLETYLMKGIEDGRQYLAAYSAQIRSEL